MSHTIVSRLNPGEVHHRRIGTQHDSKIEPSAFLGDYVYVGSGTLIGENVTIGGEAEIGDGSNVYAGAKIGRCAQIGGQSSVGSNAVVPQSVKFPAKTRIPPDAIWCAPLGCDPRGYVMTAFAVMVGGKAKLMITAGCREYTVATARKHWGPNSPNRSAIIAAAVEYAVVLFRNRKRYELP